MAEEKTKVECPVDASTLRRIEAAQRRRQRQKAPIHVTRRETVLALLVAGLDHDEKKEKGS